MMICDPFFMLMLGAVCFGAGYGLARLRQIATRYEGDEE